MSFSIPLEHFPELQNPTRILLGPGPSMVHPRVLRAMASPLLGHLDPYFLEIRERTQELLRYVFETENQLTIPISGTGSAAMEAAIANMVEPGDQVLICINGYFGERLVDMAERYGGEVKAIHRPWGEVFTPAEVQEALQKAPTKIVGIVHAETSTGALQPLDEIAEVVRDHGALLLVDAVTSLGGVSVGVDAVGIDICFSGSQKCLSCPPGLGPLTLGPRAIDVLRNRKQRVANWYLDLNLIEQYWGRERIYHHTAPISSIFALYEGLRLVAEEGLSPRWERHVRNAEYLWDGLQALGLELYVAQEVRLPMITTVKIPEGVDDLGVRSKLLQTYNIEIVGGLGALQGQVWRIGLMGHSSSRENVTLFLAALRECI